MLNPYLFIPIFIFVFIALWLLLRYIASKMGWSALAAKYKRIDPPSLKNVGIVSLLINKVNHGKLLIMKYNEEGIYFKPLLLSRPFHDPILIPWKEIKEVRDKRMPFSDAKILIVGDPVVASLFIEKKIFAKIEAAYRLHIE
jgi:hypothetical protein